MALSSELLSQFAKITNDKSNTKKETTVYGTIAEHNGGTYVKLDGSELLTPITTTTDVAVGDRVTVLIKNHSATITGNITSPAVRTETVRVVVDKVTGMETVMSDVVTTAQLNATNIRVQKLEAGEMDILGRIEANEAEIKKLAVGDLSAVYATVENLNATNARVDDLEANTLKAEDIEGKYANLDFSNIGEATMASFYARSGLIENVTIGDATISGRLVGVTISGDLIEAETLVADKLVIKGEDGLYYKLNTDGVKTEAEQTEYNSLNGEILIANSVTASKISVDDLVAFDATIGGFNITENSIYSGVKSTVGNTTRGIYLDNDGQVAFGDASNYLKYYKDSNGSYKLAISASNITFGVNNTSVETALNNVQKNIDDISIGGRNLIKGTAENIVAAGYSGANTTVLGYISYEILNERYETCRIARWAGSSTSKFNGPYYNTQHTFGVTLTVGETYVFSAWVKADIATTLTASAMAEGQTIVSYSNVVGTDWTRVHVVYTAKAASHSICLYSAGLATADAPYIYMCGLKLEKGNKPTDWSPAPEDIDTAVGDVRTAVNGVQSNLDNMTIGGRNILLDSKLEGSFNSVLWQDQNKLVSFGGDHLILSRSTEGTSRSFFVQYNSANPLLKPEFGATYSLSFDAKTVDNMAVPASSSILWRIYYNDTGTYKDVGIYFSGSAQLSSEWKRFTKVMTIDIPVDAQFVKSQFMIALGTAVGGFAFKNIKIEKGSKPTDWTPAPEDVDDAVSNVQNNLDNMAIGGRNIVMDSRLEGDYNSVLWGDIYGDATIGLYNGDFTIRRQTTSSIQWRSYFGQNSYANPLLKPILGDSYTLSIDVKKLDGFDVPATSAVAWRVHYYDKNSNRLSTDYGFDITNDNVSSEWTRLHKTFRVTVPEGGQYISSVLLIMLGVNVGGYAFRNVKIERSDKPTDWSPAPEDVDDGITRAGKTATDYMNLSAEGLVVGQNPTNPTGGNTLIGTDGVTIRSGFENLAAFKAQLRNANGITSAFTDSFDSTDNESDGVTSVKGPIYMNETRANVYIATDGNPVYFPNGIETDKVLINNDSGIISNVNILLNGSLVDNSGEGILTPLNSYGNMIIGYGRFQQGGGTHIYGDRVKAKTRNGFSASVDGLPAINTNNDQGHATFGWHLYERGYGETNIYGYITSLFSRGDIRLNADGNIIRFNGDIMPYEDNKFRIGNGSLTIHDMYLSGGGDGTNHGLKFSAGDETVLAVGVTTDGYRVFGNPTYCTNIVTKSTTTSNTGYSFKITCGENPELTVDDNDTRLLFYGGTDSTSRYIGSMAAYKRTYSSNAANMYITNNGMIGRAGSSSRRYKKDISDLSLDVVKGLYDLPVRQFKYHTDYIMEEDERYEIDMPGFIAEEVDEYFPIGCDHLDGLPEMWNSKIVVPALLKLIQDLNDRLKIFETKGA